MAGRRFRVFGGEHSRNHAVVRVPEMPFEAPVWVVDESSGAAYPAQPDGGSLVFIVERLEAGASRTFRVYEHSVELPGVHFREEPEAVEVLLGDRPFTRLLYGSDYYRPHFYPVYGPEGKEVTETAPSDHVHHRSLYVAYGEVNGEDFWSEHPARAGRVVVQKLQTVSGPVYGEVALETVWQSAAGRPVLTNDQVWRVYNLPEFRRVIEATIRFRATEGPVHFGDTKEGGIISVRVAAPIRVRETGRIENSFGGVNEAETWGKRAQWCDYSGTVEGVRLGIAVLDHLENPRHPCHWHVRNYGLMATNVFGRGTFERGRRLLDGDGSYTLPAGEALSFRYQVVVHAGDARAADIAGAYHNFVFPPRVELIEG
ncbi:MAG: hypothetical protein KatS3mg115_1791 [Candidatus Poribacteria bacterium]|nr:MAG: hypothetical protein KatS3mg115_1791 [Candidatus Poribacteria bacterium]